MLNDAKAMGAVEANEVIPCRLGAFCCVDVPSPDILDLGLVQRTGIDRVGGEGEDRALTDSQRHLFGIEVWSIDPGIGKFYPRQRPMAVHGVGHFGEHRYVIIIPEM